MASYCPHCDQAMSCEHDGNDSYVLKCRAEDCAINQSCWDCLDYGYQLDEALTQHNGEWVCAGCLAGRLREVA